MLKCRIYHQKILPPAGLDGQITALEHATTSPMTRSHSLRSQVYWWCSLCLVLHSAWNIAAFQVDVPSAAGVFTRRRRRRHLSSVCALPPILTDDFLDTASSPSSILVAEEAIDCKAIIMEKAFQDSVDFFNVSGPLGTVLIVTFAALACSVGFFIVSTDS
jgi:hypothetical protein